MTLFIATILPMDIMLIALFSIVGPLVIWERKRRQTRRLHNKVIGTLRLVQKIINQLWPVSQFGQFDS